MDIFKQGMKGPARPAPAVPGLGVTRYSPVTNWNDDPFGADVFEPNPQFAQKKKPPPRPPPPKLNRIPDVPAKPSHFMRRPTVLTSLLSRKKAPKNDTAPSLSTEVNNKIDPVRMFPKCEPKNTTTGALIDLSSPPSSPTFTTRSSSDGLSVDSFGSDATTSTSHHNALNGGSNSQAESGFEDDFDLFLHSRKTVHKEDSFDDFATFDAFSPQYVNNKPPVMKKPDFTLHGKSSIPVLNGPTIIRAKPARPKPPDNSALLKSTFGSGKALTLMNVNTTTPIQKVTNGFGESFDDQKFWDRDASPEREPSPPMPTIPPPPPPPLDDEDDLTPSWPEDYLDGPMPAPVNSTSVFQQTFDEDQEPHAIALFDYSTDHPEDLCFSANQRIKLLRRENDEWLFGSLRNGMQGLFPSNYVEIKVPLPNDRSPCTPRLGSARALYDFEPAQPGDLRFSCGDTIILTHKLNDEWYMGECNGLKGQFPLNYVQING